jgi:hypothetical protein
VKPTRLQKVRKAKEIAEKHINRSCRELRPIARDGRKWKKLADNLCS